MTENTHGKQHNYLDEQLEHLTATFAEVRRVLGGNFKRAHHDGFSTTQYMVLGLVEKATQSGEDPCTISSIANRMDLDPATVVRTVDSLEKRGLVARRRDKQDRRQVFIEFTEAGRIARQEFHQRLKAYMKTIFSAMSEEGRASLLSGLDEFVRAAQSLGEDTPSSVKGDVYACRGTDDTKHSESGC